MGHHKLDRSWVSSFRFPEKITLCGGKRQLTVMIRQSRYTPVDAGAGVGQACAGFAFETVASGGVLGCVPGGGTSQHLQPDSARG